MRRPNPILLAVLITAIIFVVFFALFHPVYDSREDVYILYLLSGGYGDPPTEMLHYNFGIHPWLGWIIKQFFILNRNINWYTIALLAAHYVSCTIILSLIIGRQRVEASPHAGGGWRGAKEKRTYTAWLAWGALFIVFEGYFLLFPDFTGASIILTITAIVYLLSKAWKGPLTPRHCIIAGIFLLVASLYRIHAMVPLIGMSLPFIALTISNRDKLKFIAVLLVSGIGIFLLNQVHQSYYKAKKPDWPQEEAYRQKVFRFFNEGAALKIPEPGQKWSTEYELTIRGLIMDTAHMPSTRLDSMYYDMKADQVGRPKFSAEWKKWFLINNRLFFCISFVFIVLYGLRKRPLMVVILSLLLLTVGFGYLLFKAKAPPYILISSLYLFCLGLFLYGQQSFSGYKKIYTAGSALLLSFFIFWGVLRAYKTSNQNKYDTELMKQEYEEIKNHPHNLFISIQKIPMHKFYVFDTPKEFSLPNYLHPELFMSNRYSTTLKRFGIRDIKDIFSSPAVLFRGAPPTGLKEYYESLAGRTLIFSDPLPGFKHATVWKIE